MPIAWHEDMSIDGDAIDNDHKSLFTLSNRFEAAIQHGEPLEELVRILGELKDCAVDHFAREEAMQQRIDFTYVEAHVREHRAFQEQMEALMAALAEGRVDVRAPSFQERLAGLLRTWLLDHVCHSDKMMCRFIES